MGNILYLAHRLPYPPDKGDKVRSYHLLRHLAARHRVFLGTFIDDPADAAHIDTVRAWCADLHVARLAPLYARLRGMASLVRGEPLTLGYYDDAGLRAWVAATRARTPLDAVVVFSSAMAQYVAPPPGPPVLVDFVDVDSAKWSQYAPRHRWPMSWLYRREGARLLDFERRVAGAAAHSFFSTANEADLFVRLAPECAGRVDAMNNGVDADFFSPAAAFPSPYPAGTRAVVFTGAMDYWPNIDAVTWFVAEVMPALRAAAPGVVFHIVGRAPAAAVKALAAADVVVTGTVADVRPYLRHAAVAVAPLRVARGIQNKVLEAMAMARPVVASAACAAAVEARAGSELVVATTSAEFAAAIGGLIADPARAAAIGAAARAAVLARYSWPAHLAGLDRHLGMAA